MAPKKAAVKAAAKSKAKAKEVAAPKAVAKAPAPAPPVQEIPDDEPDKTVSRNDTSRVLMHLAYKSDKDKNKSGEGLVEAQKALQAHVVALLFHLLFLCCWFASPS